MKLEDSQLVKVGHDRLNWRNRRQYKQQMKRPQQRLQVPNTTKQFALAVANTGWSLAKHERPAR